MMMVDRGNSDKHRTGITGNGLKGLSKVVETEKWGRDTAIERYGKPKSGGMKPEDVSAPQFEIDRPTGSRGHMAQSWVTGKDGDGRPPNFAKTPKFK
jgi:hypothetical protein